MINPFNVKTKLRFVKINSKNSSYILVKEIFRIGNIGLFFVYLTTQYLDSLFSLKDLELKKIKKIVNVKSNPIYTISDNGKKKKVGNLSLLLSKQDKSKVGFIAEVLWLLNKGVVKFYTPFIDKEISANVGKTQNGEFVVWDNLKRIVAKFKVGDFLYINKSPFLLKNGVSKIAADEKIKLSNTKRKKMFLEENKRIKFFEKKLKGNKFFKIENDKEAKLVAFKCASFYL